MVDKVEEHIGQVRPESGNSLEEHACRVKGDFEENTHIICHSFGGECLNLKKTKLVTPSAMLGFSLGGTSRSSCTGVELSKEYRSSLKRKTNTFCRNRLLINQTRQNWITLH